MNRPTVRTLIGGSVLFIGLGSVTAETTLGPEYDVNRPMMMLLAAAAPAAATSASQWAAAETNTAISNDWMNTPLSHEAEIVSALVQSRIDVVVGLSIFDAAKAILATQGISSFDVRARTVVDPEEDLHVAEIAFLIDGDFHAAMRADRQLTRQLVRQVKIPFNMSLTVREASEEFA